MIGQRPIRHAARRRGVERSYFGAIAEASGFLTPTNAEPGEFVLPVLCTKPQ